jgi:hypothetical protein
MYATNMTRVERLLVEVSEGLIVDWGDGTTYSVGANVNEELSHTYLTPYTGLVTFTVARLNDVGRIVSTQYGSGTSLVLETSTVESLTALQTLTAKGNYFYVNGQLDDFPSSLTYVGLFNTNLSGNITSIKQTMREFAVYGDNILHGNIEDIPSSVINFDVAGDNTITGDIATLKPTIKAFSILGEGNRVYGNIMNIPISVTDFVAWGGNTVTGDIGSIKTSCTTFNVSGTNTVYGSLNTLHTSMKFFTLAGTANNIRYTQGKVWGNTLQVIHLSQVGVVPLTSAEVDNLLIDLDTSTTINTLRRITITGANQQKTASSQPARASLQIKGVSLTLN